MKRKAKRKTKPRKQSSARVSSLAAIWLNHLATAASLGQGRDLSAEDCSELAMICASVLVQDETRGQK